MPLLHQDISRGGGGTDNRRHSLSDVLALDQPRFGPVVVPSTLREDFPDTRDNDYGKWRCMRNDGGGHGGRDEPGSPEAAHTPRALVPPACFPPRHPTAFASYSESARPGSGWNDRDEASPPVPAQGLTDLVASLKALAIPTAVAAAAAAGGGAQRAQLETSIQMRLSYDHDANVNVSPPWKRNQKSRETRDERLARRASFCGVTSSAGLNGGINAGVIGGVLHWSGTLPVRGRDPTAAAGYSAKVFFGGLPWDISEQALLSALAQFAPLRVEWPGRDPGVPGCGAGAGAGAGGVSGPKGFAYVTFESERRVRALLSACRRDHESGHYYYKVSSRKMRAKEAQVIPWAVEDAVWVVGEAGCARLEPARTVFVGALHGMLTAHALAQIMNDLFQGVVYAGIDTDKNKYPIGSGRVTFNNVRSYVRAVSAAYIVIHTDKFTKKVQVDPYLEDSMCSVCNLHQGPYFCREPVCFRYFCCSCWNWQHPSDEHKRLMRTSRSAVNGVGYANGAVSNGEYAANGAGSGNAKGSPNGHAYSNGHCNGSPTGLTFGQRLSPLSDNGSVYIGSGTGSPSTSASGTSAGSELEQSDHSELAWLPR